MAQYFARREAERLVLYELCIAICKRELESVPSTSAVSVGHVDGCVDHDHDDVGWDTRAMM